MTITTECKCCGKEFSWERVPGVRGRMRRHCSTKCAAAWASKNRPPRMGVIHLRECKVCEKAFSTKLLQHVTCSPECRRKWNAYKQRQRTNKPLGHAACEQCGRQFGVTINKKRFCSHECKGANNIARRAEAGELMGRKWTSSDLLKTNRIRSLAERRRHCSGCGHAYLETQGRIHRTLCKACRAVAHEANQHRACEDCGTGFKRLKSTCGRYCDKCRDARMTIVARWQALT